MSILDFAKGKVTKLSREGELNSVNIILQGEECLISLSTIEDEEIIVRTLSSSMVKEAIIYAESLSYEYDLPMELYFGHIVFSEEYPSRRLKRMT